MSSGMPELGSKISLISKADIRYEGRLFTVDPQECTIALADVRSFGTEDREAQFPVAPQSQVYQYILFRGADIKDIRVLNNVGSIPNDPAIMQMSMPPTAMGGAGPGAPPGQFGREYNHPVGQPPYAQYHPMAGFPSGMHTQMGKSSSMLDLISGGSQQNSSRSATPLGHRKSPTADQGTQAGASGAGPKGEARDRRGSNTAPQPPNQQQRNRTNSRNRQRYPSGGQMMNVPPPTGMAPAPGPHHQNQMHQPHMQHQQQHQQHQQNQGGYNNRGGWRGRSRGRGRGFVPRTNNKLKFDNDYDFEQANTEFEELRTQLAKTKISDAPETKPEQAPALPGEVDKKDDSGNETGAGEPEVEEDPYTGYDKKKSFFDNISCEAIERSKGRSQRTDWRTERKLNSETFGVSSARRGAWRSRPGWRQHPHQPWRQMRGGSGGGGGNNRGRPNNMHYSNMPHQQHNNGPQQRPRANAPQPAAQPTAGN